MPWVHRTDRSRTATLRQGGLVTWVDAAGHPREEVVEGDITRTVAGAGATVLLREGFVLAAPNAGPIQWLTATEEPFPHGFPFALAPDGSVWVADTASLRRITPGTCAEVAIAIGAGVMPRSIGCSVDGTVCALVDHEPETPVTMKGPFRPPVQGRHAFRWLAVRDALTVTVVLDVPSTPGEALLDQLSVADSGRILGPHADGAALYEPDGTVVLTTAVSTTQHHLPKGAVSPDGVWIAVTAEGGAVDRIRVATRARERFPAGFSQILGMEVRVTGEVLVAGFRESGWGLWALHAADSPPERLSGDIRAALSPDGTSIVEVEPRQLIWRVRGSGTVLGSVDVGVLDIIRFARAVFASATTVVVRTDSHTLAGVSLVGVTRYGGAIDEQ